MVVTNEQIAPEPFSRHMGSIIIANCHPRTRFYLHGYFSENYDQLSLITPHRHALTLTLDTASFGHGAHMGQAFSQPCRLAGLLNPPLTLSLYLGHMSCLAM